MTNVIGKPPGYGGCGNCKHQPEPLVMCEWGRRRDYVELICSGWELREEDHGTAEEAEKEV